MSRIYIINASGKECVCFIPRILNSNFSNTSAGTVDYTYIHTYNEATLIKYVLCCA